MKTVFRISAVFLLIAAQGHGQFYPQDALRRGSARDEAATEGRLPLSEVPMYGGVSTSDSELKAERDVIASAMRGRGRTAAAGDFAVKGWAAYAQDDERAAIQGFNRAWFLDPDNHHALWGFAAISRVRENYLDAVKYYEEASQKRMSTGDKRKLLAEYADAMLQAVLEGQQTIGKEQALQKAARLFDQSSELGELSGHELCRWGETLCLLGRYDEAREKVRLAEATDGHVHEALVARLEEVE